MPEKQKETNEEGREEEGEDVATRIGPCRRWDHHPWPSTPPEMEKKKASAGGGERERSRERVGGEGSFGNEEGMGGDECLYIYFRENYH